MLCFFVQLLYNDRIIIIMCLLFFLKKENKNVEHINIFVQLFCKIVVQLTYLYAILYFFSILR
jgi:hypothetical protein